MALVVPTFILMAELSAKVVTPSLNLMTTCQPSSPQNRNTAAAHASQVRLALPQTSFLGLSRAGKTHMNTGEWYQDKLLKYTVTDVGVCEGDFSLAVWQPGRTFPATQPSVKQRQRQRWKKSRAECPCDVLWMCCEFASSGSLWFHCRTGFVPFIWSTIAVPREMLLFCYSRVKWLLVRKNKKVL